MELCAFEWLALDYFSASSFGNASAEEVNQLARPVFVLTDLRLAPLGAPFWV